MPPRKKSKSVKRTLPRSYTIRSSTRNKGNVHRTLQTRSKARAKKAYNKSRSFFTHRGHPAKAHPTYPTKAEHGFRIVKYSKSPENRQVSSENVYNAFSHMIPPRQARNPRMNIEPNEAPMQASSVANMNLNSSRRSNRLHRAARGVANAQRVAEAAERAEAQRRRAASAQHRGNMEDLTNLFSKSHL